ncbi:Integral membrane protein, YjbE family [Georgfuchsia toluolica]|uniref:Integral membrane protein, YjbE family n=1 Tax=Georgfuchsia toluolica TaxID=424218 RepID=A0A916J4V6_9PROT|nr:TerC family protein [Georgfuchsia toluolica]CAG4883940.1 Integral membrane protein, YjbE family [Georgfuchsia toluolica]
MDFSSAHFWVAVAQIVMIDVVLSGDNAVVIALACRKLPTEQRHKGILWGVAGAVTLRIILTAFAALLLSLPYIKFGGGLLLLWIGVKLLLPEDGHGEGGIDAADNLWGAVKTIIVADFVMSIDNVIAVAGAAHGSLGLLIFGLAVSIPLIIWSSQFVLKLMDRFPVIVTGGAALLGWVAGSMIATDVVLKQWLEAHLPYADKLFATAGAVLVVAMGYAIARRMSKRKAMTELPIDTKEKS